MAKSRSAEPNRSKPNQKQADRGNRKPIATKDTAPARRNRRRKTAPRDQGTYAHEPKQTKKQACINLLSRPDGVSLDDLQQATGWQRHSVRGFLSGTVRKMPGIALTSDTADDGPRHYRIVKQRKRAES